MKRNTLTSVSMVAVFSLFHAGQPVVRGDEFELNGHTFSLPDGFEIELAAGPPLVDRPIVADFDEEGRLYVADSSGSNEKVEEQLRKKPHRIVRLEDKDGDGRFEHRTVFADQMMFPEGAMWLAGSLYVAAPPSIWKLTDTDGDGVADERFEWFQGKTLTGCANDLHGPYLGPDGWIYWCKGAFAEQTYHRPGRSPFVTRAAHIFRCRPDGSAIEPVMTGGMDNPVEIVFTPGGERILTTTFFEHPGGGRRDGLIHAIYGGVYGKEHGVLDGHKRTGPAVMPVLTHLGPAAPAGLVRFQSDGLGAAFQGNLFAALFNLQRVTRHVLSPNGATFETQDEDFLVSSNRDFHPTDVIEDAGTLLVIDTGGWYKLCCPTSQLGKPDVLGAIYRVRLKAGSRPVDPRGLKLPWSKMAAEELAVLLDDPREAVRRRAVQNLSQKGAIAVPALASILRHAPSPEARRNAVWTLARIEHASARALARVALTDSDETVRQAAIHCASVWRDSDAVPALIDLLNNSSPHNQRAAAESLGRIGNKAAVPAILATFEKPADRALQHSLTFALIEIADREGTAGGLQSVSGPTRRAAMIALDQMVGRLELKAVLAELASADPQIKETALWIISRHPEWGGSLTGFLREQLTAENLNESKRQELLHLLSRLASNAPIQELLAGKLSDPASSHGSRLIVLGAMAESGVSTIPDAWIAALRQTLASDDAELIERAVTTAGALRVPKEQSAELVQGLLRVAQDAEIRSDTRLQALAAVPDVLLESEPNLIAFLHSQLEPDQAVATRVLAADVFSRTKLGSEQLLVLTESFTLVGPMELNRLLGAFTQSTDEKVGIKLVAALKASPARSSLRAETLKPLLAKFGPLVEEQAAELYAAVHQEEPKQKARLEELLATLEDGDARRGQAIFNSSKAACSSCHAVGYRGGNIGPDLTQVGRIRGVRDLLEAIVYPSASFVRNYEPVVVATEEGKVYEGVLRQDSPDEISLALGLDKQVRIARQTIEDMQPGTVSTMPAGLDQQLTPRELSDLVAFLKACQ